MLENDIKERIGIHKVTQTFLESYGWLVREQNVSDIGIDMQVELVENGSPTGLLYALQVKSGNSYTKGKESDKSITFYIQHERHVNYWPNHSLPVILVICDLENDTIYWDFISHKTISQTPKGWKVIIPKENILGSETSRKRIQNYYFNNDNFAIMESIDTSHALSRRIAMKVICRNISRVIIEKQISQLIEGLKTSDYYRSEIVENYYKDKPADSVWIWLYKDIEQYKNGYQFCTAYWNHPDSKSPTTFRPDDREIQNGIFISYSDLGLNDDHFSERLTKGKYLKIIDNFLLKSDQIFNKINTLFLKYKADANMSVFNSEVLKYKNEFQELLPDEYHEKIPPLECSDLGQKISEINAAIDNIFIILEDPERTDRNVIACIEKQTKTYQENIGAAKYEREKVT